MRQTLFYIPPTLFGLPVFGFGLALALLAAAVAVAVAFRYAKTKKIDEDSWSYLGLLLIGGGILTFVAPNVMEPGGFPIRGYGVCLLVAILASLGLTLHLAKRRGISSELIFSLCLWAVVSGILGARLFYVTEYWSDMVARDASGTPAIGPTLYNLVNIANGGLVVYGSILGGALGSFVFMLRNRMPVLATFDSMAPAMMLGIAIGRIGCFLNGCCFGGPTDLCVGVVFPEGSPAHIHQIEHGQTYFYGLKFRNVCANESPRVAVERVQPNSDAERAGLKPGMILRGIGGTVREKPVSREAKTVMEALRLIDEFQHENPGGVLRFDVCTDNAHTETRPYFVGPSRSAVLPVHPTQIYSSLGAATLCILLVLLGRTDFFRRRDGLVFAAFLISYAVGRFGIEMIRTDEDSFLGSGLTVSQNICIGVFVAGIALFVYVMKKPGIAATGRNS